MKIDNISRVASLLFSLYLLQECFNLRLGRGAVQRLSSATLLLCIERCQLCLMRFLRRLVGISLRGLAALIDRRIFFISQCAENFGYLLIYFFFRHKLRK